MATKSFVRVSGPGGTTEIVLQSLSPLTAYRTQTIKSYRAE